MSRIGGMLQAVYKSATSLVAQLPTSTAAGGNARGVNAVDWQQTRTLATQVASGLNSTLGGGIDNTASGSSGTVGGGESCTASGARSTVAGGNVNTASGANAAIGGGSNNGASGSSAAIAGGSTNTASGVNSWVPGGAQATTRLITGRGAWSGGRITANGDVQCGEHHLSRQTTDATATRLTADNAAVSTINTINMPNFSVYSGTLTVVAKATGSTDTATWRLQVSAVRGNGVATVVVYEGAAAAIVPTASNGTGSTWRLDIAADTTNGAIAVTGTGALATTINWSARYANVEATTAS